MGKSKKNVLTRVLVLISLLPFYYGSVYMEDSLITNILHYSELFFGIGAFALLLVEHKFRITISKISIFIWILYIYLFIVSVVNHADTSGLIRQWISMVYILAVFDLMRDELDDVLFSIQWFLGILIFINLITMVLMPEGMGTTFVPEGGYNILYFLGGDHSQILYFLPCFIVCQYRIIQNQATNSNVVLGARFLQAIIIANIFVTKVSLTLIWLAAFILAYIVFKDKIWNKKIMTFIMLLVPVILNLFIVIFRKEITVVTIFVQQYLGKSATFTGRIYVWNNASKLIAKHPIWGLGYYGNKTMPNLIGYQQAHNLLLQLCLIGGMVLVALFILILRELFVQTFSINNSRVAALNQALLISYLIYMVGESQFNYKMLLFMPLIWHIARANEVGRS